MLAVADAGERRKPWIAAFSVLLVAGSCGLWLASPGRTDLVFTVLIIEFRSFREPLAIVIGSVLALTGTDPDRFAEEKARGLTIDLGFAFTTLPSGTEVKGDA